MERRATSPEITAIHDRLDKLEEISDDMKEIKEWIATVVKVTRFFEVAGCFLGRWAVIWLKFTAAIGFTWAAFKLGMGDILIWLRGLLKP